MDRAATKTIRRSIALQQAPAIAIFARAPVPGKTKTRLIPTLGANGAAELHRALVADTLLKIEKLKVLASRYVFISGGEFPKGAVPGVFECRRQQGRDLAGRLGRAFTELLRRHPGVVIIGTDSPEMAPSTVRIALEELRVTDAVLGPCPDGGFYLIGLGRAARGLFNNVRMGTRFAFRDMLDSLTLRGFSCSVLQSCPDIDRPQDLATLKKSLIKNPAIRSLMPETCKFFRNRVSSHVASVGGLC